MAAFVLMGLASNWIAGLGVMGIVAFYVGIYTIWLKRRSPQNIVIGGAAGAAPPLIAWLAAGSVPDMTGFGLFLIIFLWTPPHFWALALLVSGGL